MGVCFCQELHASCFCKFPERSEHFGGIQPELVDYDSRQGEGYPELALVLSYQVKDYPVCRQIAVCSNLPQDRLIHEIVIVVVFMTHLEETVASEPEGLMNLEVKAYCLFL